jgi:hypothetical protein
MALCFLAVLRNRNKIASSVLFLKQPALVLLQSILFFLKRAHHCFLHSRHLGFGVFKDIWSMVLIVFLRPKNTNPMFHQCFAMNAKFAGLQQGGASYGVPLPDLVVCDPSPWDATKATRLNISGEMLSYLSYLLFPQSLSSKTADDNEFFTGLEDRYRTLLRRFDNSPIRLLNNVTKDCEQLIFTCNLGTTGVIGADECCPLLFSNVEYTPLYKCFSSGGKNNFSMLESSQEGDKTEFLFSLESLTREIGKIREKCPERYAKFRKIAKCNTCISKIFFNEKARFLFHSTVQLFAF